jgi:hypothetical protein
VAAVPGTNKPRDLNRYLGTQYRPTNNNSLLTCSTWSPIWNLLVSPSRKQVHHKRNSWRNRKLRTNFGHEFHIPKQEKIATDWLLNYCWPLPVQWFLVASPAGLMTIFFSLTALGAFRLPMQNRSYLTTGGLAPISSSWRQVPWDSRPEIFVLQLNPWGHSPYVTSSLTKKMGLSLMNMLRLCQVYVWQI